PMVPGVCWEVMEGRGGVMRNGGVGQKTGEEEQGLIIATLRDELRKLKGKAITNTIVTTHTIDPEMLKVDAKPIAPRLLNNRTVHSDYLRLTQEQAAILREVMA
nr:hypothetical protein [Tanacetum cinerariifolium]